MPTYGVTPTGFVQKRLADISASMKTRLQAITDSNGNTIIVDLADSSLISQMVQIVSEEYSEGWEMASAVATQFDPRYNTGPFQSGTVQINGIFRNASTPTKLQVTLTGTTGTAIPSGTLIATSDNLHTFTLDATYTLAGGTATGYATSTEKVPIVVANSASMNIQNPISGWTNVVCASTAVTGTAEETDEALRIRQQASTQVTAQRETEAIIANVANVAGVTFATVYENANTDVGGGVDSKGIPIGAICAVVQGGVDQDVADAIYNRMSCMTLTHGATTVSYDLVAVKFQRPTGKAVQVQITVAAKNSQFPTSTYVALVKTAIAEFALATYKPGQQVYATEIATAVNALAGVIVTAITVSNNNTTFGSTAAIAWNEIATLAESAVTVTGP
jgi:uncharacterized phage protein gp47/JayE